MQTQTLPINLEQEVTVGPLTWACEVPESEQRMAVMALSMLYQAASDLDLKPIKRVLSRPLHPKGLLANERELLEDWISAHIWVNDEQNIGSVCFEACSAFFESEMARRYNISVDHHHVREGLMKRPRELKKLISIMLRDMGGW